MNQYSASPSTCAFTVKELVHSHVHKDTDEYKVGYKVEIS